MAATFSPPTLLKFAPLAVLLFGGCATVPDLGPRPALREAASVAATQSLPGSDTGAWPGPGLWASYGDPQLAALIEEALRNSPDVAAALARVRQAEGLAQQAGASRLPSLDVQGQAGLDKQSSNNGIPAQFIPNGWNDRAQVAAVLGFDLDLWGRNRAALAAAVSEQRAATIDAAQAQLLLSAAVAATYSDLGTAFAEQDVRRRALAVRQASRDLIARRFDNGLENRGSVRQGDAEVARAGADLARADADIALRRHQLAALVGAGPDRGLAISRPALSAVPLRALPRDVTTDLVGRRPDIVAARERTEAAAQRIKVARADFYPAIRLDALVGLQSLGFGNLANSGSTYGSVGPAISLPIFHGGAIEGGYRNARGRFDEAVADYDRAVVDAYRQVADAVTGTRTAAVTLGDARTALAASEDAYRIAQDRYRGGLANYLAVLTVEDRLLAAREAVAMAEAAVRSNDIALLRALGGGFTSNGSTGQRKGSPDA